MTRKALRKWIGASVLLVPLALFLSFPLLGRGWHLLHGDFISYDGWRVRVPRDYCVLDTKPGPTIWKLELGAPIFRVPYAHINLFGASLPKPFHYETDWEYLANSTTAVAEGNGFRLLGSRAATIGKRPAHCLEFVRPNGRPDSQVRCAIEGTRLFVTYEGHRKYVSDFYSVLHGMSLEMRNP